MIISLADCLIHNMSICTKDSVSPEDSSKKSKKRNETKNEPTMESQEEKDSPDTLERMLHKSSGEMTYASSVDGSVKESNSEKNYLTLSYLMWENNSNICWLDASMSLLIHNKSVRHLVDSSASSLISKNIKMFDEAMTLLNDDNNPKDIHLRVIEAKGILKQIQDATLKYLQPSMKFKEGEPDSAFCSLYNLITENKTTRAVFEVDYAMVLDCVACQYHKARRHKKPTITLTKVEAFDPLAPMCVGACPNCKAPNQVHKLSYRSLPQSLVFHFESGAGKGEFSTLDFSLCDRQYRLTGLMVLEKCLEDAMLNHFVTWIRDPLTDSWLECNDLNSEIVTFSVVSPFIQLEDVCIAMYEALDSKGTLPYSSGASEEDSEDRVSKGEADIPFIDLSDDEGQGKDDGPDGSQEKGSKVTSCKVQKTNFNAITSGDSIEHQLFHVLKSSNEGELESGGPKAEIGDSEKEPLNECDRKKEICLSKEPQKDISKSPKNNKVSSIRRKLKMSESKIQSKEDKDLLGEDLKYKTLMEKIQENKLKGKSNCKKEIQSEIVASEDSPRRKLRSDANSDHCKMEKSLNKNDSESSYYQIEGDINPAETGVKASSSVSTCRNRNSKQIEETEVLNSSDIKEESKENLNNGSQGVNASSLPVNVVSSEASKLSSICNSQVEEETNKASIVISKSRRKPPNMPLLRRSCRTRKFTPKIIESLRQSEEEKSSDLLAKGVACKRRGQQLNGFKSPQRQGKQAKVARKILRGSLTGLDAKRGSPADKVEKIFNSKEWDVRKINPPVHQLTVCPITSAKAPVKSNKYSEEMSGYLDLTLQEFKEKVKSEENTTSKDIQNGISTTSTLEMSNDSSGNKIIENSSTSKPRVLSEIPLVFGSSSGQTLGPLPKTIPNESLHKGSSNCKSKTLSKITHMQNAGESETFPSSNVHSSIQPVYNGFLTSPGEISLHGSKSNVSPTLQRVCQDTEKSSSVEVKAEDCRKVIGDSFDPECTGTTLPSVPLRAKRKVKSDYSPKRKRTRSDLKCVPAKDCIRSTVKNYFNFTCTYFQV